MKKSNENIELTEKDFEFICPIRTNEMKAIEGGYFCNDCEKKVYDVSHYTKSEFTTLKTKESNLCINFKKVAITSLILNSALCIASDITLKSNINENYFIAQQKNRLSPISPLNLNQAIFLEHREEIELGGGAVLPVYFWKEEIVVPVEPFIPTQKDENSTEAESQTIDGNSKV